LVIAHGCPCSLLRWWWWGNVGFGLREESSGWLSLPRHPILRQDISGKGGLGNRSQEFKYCYLCCKLQTPSLNCNRVRKNLPPSGLARLPERVLHAGNQVRLSQRKTLVLGAKHLIVEVFTKENIYLKGKQLS
jgi:hypothetical protein